MTDLFRPPPEAADEVRRRLRQLRARARRGLWLLCLFLAASVALLRAADSLPRLPPEPGFLLGHPPSAGLVSLALVAYGFSAIILTLGRIANQTDSGDGLHHLGYLSAFYGFYHAADALKDNFWAVFAAGVTILGLVAYNNWNCQREPLQEAHARLDRLTRLGGPDG